MSLLGFCDEVVVLDGGSDDGTWEELQTMAKLQGDGRLVVKQNSRNWREGRFALYDGQQKAISRTLCTKEWCWQSDIDEIVHEDDWNKIKKIIRQIPKQVTMITLPVTEFWGSKEKVRVDINPWKQRLSKNLPNITHDVCASFRAFDENGELYSKGTDGCEFVYIDNYETIPATTFYTPELHEVRQKALLGDREALEVYERYMNKVVEELPGVFHYSWFDIKRKIYTYKNYWSKHWSTLYNKVIDDTPENNMFFDKAWEDVTDQEIDLLAKKMKIELGGWVFHSKLNFEKPTPWIICHKKQPAIMNSWIEKHSREDEK